jgi:hypothetical protein
VGTTLEISIAFVGWKSRYWNCMSYVPLLHPFSQWQSESGRKGVVSNITCVYRGSFWSHCSETNRRSCPGEKPMTLQAYCHFGLVNGDVWFVPAGEVSMASRRTKQYALKIIILSRIAAAASARICGRVSLDLWNLV